MFDVAARNAILITVGLYFIAIIAHSYYFYRKDKTYEDYVAAGRNIPIFPLILTIVGTAIGGATVLGFMTDAYLDGLSRLWMIAPIYVVMAIWTYFLVKPIRNIGEKYNMYTIPDFTALRFGEGARLPSLISILFAYSAITGLQFIAIATFLNLIFDLPITAGIFIGWLVLTIKTYLGGLGAVIWADSVQGTIQTIGIFVLLMAVYASSGGWNSITENADIMGKTEMLDVFAMSATSIFVFIFTLGAYQVIRQDTWQRVWAAKNINIAVKGNWLAILIGVLSSIAIILIGTFGNLGLGLETDTPALIFYQIVNEVLPVPIMLIVITALIATIISCADSFFMAGASSIANDIIKPRVKIGNEHKMLQYSRYSVLILSVIALLLSLYIPQLVTLWVTGTAMLTSGLMIPVLAGFLWKRATNAGGVASMWGGLITAVVWQLSGHPLGIHPVFIGLAISLVLMVTVSLVTKPSSDKIVEDTYYFNINNIEDNRKIENRTNS